MARALLAVLACSIAATAARDHDYSGPPIPHYHFEPGSREAMLLDYEYYDKPVADPALFDSDGEKPRYAKDRTSLSENIRPQRQKQVISKYLKEEDSIEDEFEHEDSLPEFKSTSQPRKKNMYYRNGNREITHSRIADDDIDNLDTRHSLNDHDRDENRRGYDMEDDKYHVRQSVRRKSRRKPRDRAISRDIPVEKEREIERVDIRRPRADDLEEDYLSEIRKTTEEVEPSSKQDFANRYKDEDEYFDMKRINGIKNKLPTLLRRNKVSISETSSQQQHLEGRNRRANREEPTSTQETNATTPATTVTKKEQTISASSTAATKSSVKLPTNTTEISLAEKSRLSILRKSQRKESLKNTTWTTKPPVLLQVTQRMQTVIMVERLNDKDRRLELKEISNESPRRVLKAKKLMRHKLVADAKSIQDLTDNWDEMVCDYIDVSLLENTGPASLYHVNCALLLSLQLVWIGF